MSALFYYKFKISLKVLSENIMKNISRKCQNINTKTTTTTTRKPNLTNDQEEETENVS